MLSAGTPDATTLPSSPCTRHVVYLLLFAFFVRVTVAYLGFERFAADPDGYRELGERIAAKFDSPRELWRVANGAGRVAYRPPLYPLLLAATGGISTDQLELVARLHVILGLLTVWLTVRLGAKLGLGNFSLLAGVLVALDPILLNQSTLVMTETLATCLAVAAIDLLAGVLERPRLLPAISCGFLLGACCLCRPTFLPFAAFAPLVLFALTWKASGLRWAPALRFGLMVSLGVVVLVGGWGYRNHHLLGRWVFGTTHGGYTFLLGNNERFFEYVRGDASRLQPFDAESIREKTDQISFRSYAAFRAELAKVLGSGFPKNRQAWRTLPREEVRADDLCYEEAWSAIQHDKSGFAWACLYRVRRFWGLVPYASPGRATIVAWGIGVYYSVLFAFALAGLWQLARSRRLWQSAWFFGLLLTLTFMAVHTVYWTDMRMRAPIMPVVCLAAVVGVQSVWWKRRAANGAAATT